MASYLSPRGGLTMFDIFFGYDLYDKLFAVRVMADRGEPLESYTIEDVQAPDIRERFAKDLVRSRVATFRFRRAHDSGIRAVELT